MQSHSRPWTRLPLCVYLKGCFKWFPNCLEYVMFCTELHRLSIHPSITFLSDAPFPLNGGVLLLSISSAYRAKPRKTLEYIPVLTHTFWVFSLVKHAYLFLTGVTPHRTCKLHTDEFNQDLNWAPSCYEEAVLTTTPLCCPGEYPSFSIETH